MNDLPVRVFDADGVRTLDRCAIERAGIDGYTLMCRAGDGLLSALQSEFPSAGRILIVCGAGNNAGDGYVLGRLAMSAGYEVGLAVLVSPDKLEGDAARAYAEFAECGGVVRVWDAKMLSRAELVVDAVLGTGLTRDVGGGFAEAIGAVNASGLPVLAVDIPSGLDADDGRIRGVAVRASATATFVGLKAGLLTGHGPDMTGSLHFFDLGLPDSCLDAASPVLRRLDMERIRTRLGRRPRSAHKGRFGHLLIIGGSPGMGGAVRLAGEAALRTGAGLVTIATHPDHAAIIASGRSELMCRGVETPGDIESLLDRASHLAIGPGLGQDAWGRALFAAALAAELPAVLDADGLNLLAERPQRRDDWILTPHPGEAARLLGTESRLVQTDRIDAAKALRRRYGGIAVLKGAGTLVISSEDDPPAICDRGNPGMASAGMGDALTGIIGGLLAQGLSSREAAEAGVLIHALAGDAAAETDERGLIASDLIAEIRRWVNPCG